MKGFRRTVRPGNYHTDEESLAAYSYDGSGLEGKPAVILTPQHEEELRRIIVHANQQRLPLIPRGSGTGVRGGVVRAGGVVVNLRGFTTLSFDKQRGTADVGAGVTIGALQKAAAKHNLSFPLSFANQEATVGGLAATNMLAEESFLFGDWQELVEQVEAFDGLGRLNRVAPENIIGKEGTTGIITRLRLKLNPPYEMKSTIHEGGVGELLQQAESEGSCEKVIALEYLDTHSSELLGLGASPHLLVVQKEEKGGLGDTAQSKTLLAQRRELPFLLWREGFGRELDFTVDEQSAERFITWCAKEGVVCYGHLGAGVLFATPRDGAQRRTILHHALALGAVPGGKHGYGRVLGEYVPDALKKKVGRLKETRDYNHILNPGVIM